MSGTQRPPPFPGPAPGPAPGSVVEAVPDWLAGALAPVADDFDARVVRSPDGAADEWRPAGPAGLEVRTLECLTQAGSLRFTGQLRTAEGADPAGLGELRGAELLVQRGALELDGRARGAGTYLRLPRGARVAPDGDAARASGAPGPRLGPGALAYLSIGQIEPTDSETRIIDTTDPTRWLDGPVDGVEVLALHGHRTGNVMLVRWSGPAAFRPKLDPSGEELLVLEGTLHDARGSYPAGSWLRTPVPAWQSWGGAPGTLVCYKSGHFGELR